MTALDAVAPDGSPVAIYRLLPDLGEVDLIRACLPAGASILELGCGAGRMTAGLLALGHRVTAVDESEAMLAAAEERTQGARYVLARIGELSLGETYAVVLLASRVINNPEVGPAALATARRHLAPDGLLLVEAYPEDVDWPAQVGRVTVVGAVSISLTRAHVADGRLDATVHYEVEDRAWEQSFVADLLDETAIRRSLSDAGLAFDAWIGRERGWFAARPTLAHRAIKPALVGTAPHDST